MREDPPGWVKLRRAAERVGLSYETFRHLVKGGVFTTCSFSLPGKRNPPVFVAEVEVELFRTGGIAAVAARRGIQAQETGT